MFLLILTIDSMNPIVHNVLFFKFQILENTSPCYTCADSMFYALFPCSYTSPYCEAWYAGNTNVSSGMSITCKGFYATTKLIFIHSTTNFYATSAPKTFLRTFDQWFYAFNRPLCVMIQISNFGEASPCFTRAALFYVLLEHFDIHCWDNYLYASYIILYIIVGINFIHCWYKILYIVRAVVCVRRNVYLVKRFLCVNKNNFYSSKH
jgi:hypothetical protein